MGLKVTYADLQLGLFVQLKQNGESGRNAGQEQYICFLRNVCVLEEGGGGLQVKELTHYDVTITKMFGLFLERVNVKWPFN